MAKVFNRILYFVITCFVILFVLANVDLWINEILPMLAESIKPSRWITFDLARILQSELLTAIAAILIGISLMSLILNYMNDRSKIRKRSRYDKVNYSKLLSKFERRRGTSMMKYLSSDTDQTTTESGLIKSWYRFKTPFAKRYNKLITHFMLPATRRWNEIKYDEMGKEIIAGGVPVMAMRKYGLFGDFDKVWYLTGDMHSLFVGSTGRGKTFTFVLLMIYSYIQAGESIVVHDPKREIDAMTRRALEIAGYKVIVIDFVDPKNSDGWNPLDVAYAEWKRSIDLELESWETSNSTDGNIIYSKNIYFSEELVDNEIVPSHYKTISFAHGDRYKEGYKYANVSTAVELVMAVSQALTWEEDAKDPIWHLGAGDMFAGGALFAMEEGIDKFVNAKTARYLVELGDDADQTGAPLLKKYLKKFRNDDSESVRKFATYLNAEGNMKASFKSVFTNKVSLLTANDDIMNMTSTTTFDMQKVFQEKTAIFLKTHDERSTYYPLVTLFLKQLYEVGIKETREHLDNQRLKIPMNWIIDEMGLLPEIMDIEALYGAARSRGVRINAFIQTFEQLEDKYEDKIASIIEDNSMNVIYLGSQTTSTRERFSKLAGDELVYDKKKKEFITRPVITPERLKSFEKGRALINTVEWNPFVSKLPPYNKYIFFEEPIWEIPKVEKKSAEYFNIQTEWKKRSMDANSMRRKRSENKGSKFYTFGGEEGKTRHRGIFAGKA